MIVLALFLPACGLGGTEVSVTFSGTDSPAQTSPVTSSSETTVTSLPPVSTSVVSTTVPNTFEVVVVGSEVEGGGRIAVPLGEEVTLLIHSDVVDEAHLHGYDLHTEVGPDAEGELVFKATIPGIFELELENSGLLLAEVEVS